MNVREYLKDNILLFDGAMGTYLTSMDHSFQSEPERACLEKPDLVAKVHEDYLKAGAKAIKTNTFGANRQNFPDSYRVIIQKAYELATQQAQKHNAFVFADIGPVESSQDPKNSTSLLTEVADLFIEMGATNFLFETNSNAEGLCETAEHIKQRVPEAYIITSFAVLPDGFSREGVFTSELAKTINQCRDIDAFGLNCAQGAVHMLEMAQRLSSDTSKLSSDKAISLMPNAGYPIVIGHRTVYEGDPMFFAQSLCDMVKTGARIIGGCCGTTPLHIQEVAKALSTQQPVKTETKKKQEAQADTVTSAFWDKLTKGEKVIAVELDPPENAMATKFMAGAKQLQEAGVDILTIADCPIARARMDSSILACKVNRELGLEALPHMTCRDRNLNATKALLLGLYSEGIRNVLLVTGDPIPTAERDEVKSVYQFNSRKLAAFVSGLGQEALPSSFHIFGALNVNALNFDVQLKLAKDKMAKGMAGFLTQPVLTPKAVENLSRAREELKGAYILGGMIPVVSERNARFMDSEINGISVDPRIIEAYKDKDRSQGEQLALEITSRIAREIAPYVDGYYIVTPFQRTALVKRIIEAIR